MEHVNHELYSNRAVKAGKKEWIGLAVLTLPTIILAMDMTVLYLALPHLSADLMASNAQSLWIMDIYGFMIAGFLVTMGTLGDRIGRKRLLLIGAVAFGITSILAAYSTSVEMLIVTRALLGIAGATVMPSTLALISNMFRNPNQRGMAIGIWMSSFMLGTMIGPVVGGVMIEVFWWGAVFLLAVPVMVLLLITGPFVLPEYRDPSADRLDLISVVLSLAAVLTVIYGIKKMAESGVQGLPLLSIVIGLIIGVLFWRRQSRLAHPLVDTSLFKNHAFSVALGVLLAVFILMGGVYMFITQYLQMVVGHSPLAAGLWLLPSAAAMTIGSLISPVLAQKISPRYVIGIGLLISTAGYLLLTQVEAVSGMTILLIGFTLAYMGGSPTIVLGTDLVVGSAPVEKAGSAAALSETSSEIGIAVGIAILGSIGAMIYRHRLTDTISADIPSETVSAAADSITGATTVATQLPESMGAAILEPAQAAFTQSLHAVGGISAVAVFILAVLIMVFLRPSQSDIQTLTEVEGNQMSKSQG